MKDNSSQLHAIPTNIISGFLGAGKTTVILSLLKAKPQQERWAVLVNEFGEIGIDGKLFKDDYPEQTGVFIREVPGGCMCCAAGLPMSVALNQLLLSASPDRLLIEPTGLGHPREILEVLGSENYRQVLDLHQNITLVDARKLTDLRYTNHATFNQQIDIADIIVGSKSDLYQEQDKTNLENYIAQRKQREIRIIFTDHGNLAPALLEGASETAKLHIHNAAHRHHEQGVNFNDNPIPECGYLKAENTGEDFHYIGWRVSPEKIFRYEALFKWLNEFQAERIKAVMITEEGSFSFNKADDVLACKKSNNIEESRIEIIARKIDARLETALMDCMLTAAGTE